MAVFLVGLGGCGGDEGVAEGAAVSAYVDATLCGEAKGELDRSGGGTAEIRVRVVCLTDTRQGDKLDLAAIGANARRASEDSTAVAYIEAPNPAAARFSHSLLESAGIPIITSESGATAMTRLLDAIQKADPNSLRDSVLDALQ